MRMSVAAVAAMICTTGALAACGGSDESTEPSTAAAAGGDTTWPATTVDLGGGREATFEEGQKPRFVYFAFNSDVYISATAKGAKEEAEKLGIELDVLDAEVDPAKQVRQMQDAMQSGKYAGGIVTPVVESQLCGIGTEQMPERNMMLVVTNSPLCGRTEEDGEGTWAPGSLAFVGGTQTPGTFRAFAARIQQDNPGKQRVIVVAGPELNSQSELIMKAFDSVAAEHPDFEIAAKVHTDFSTADAQRKMQDALQANPGTTVVATIFSALTKGAVVALKQAGKTEGVKLYDIGGDSTVIPLIESGEVAMTYPYYPETKGRVAVQALYNARMGKPFERFYANDGHAPEELREPGEDLLFITKENVGDWKSSGLGEY